MVGGGPVYCSVVDPLVVSVVVAAAVAVCLGLVVGAVPMVVVTGQCK